MTIKKSSGLHWRDSESLEWYAAKGVDLVQRSPLGGQLERLHDEVGASNALPSTVPGWVIDYSEHTDSARARRIAMRLARCGPTAAAVLMAYHDPAAVGCDGLAIEAPDGTTSHHGKLGAGRILAIYGMTPTAADARRWHAEHEGRAAASAVARLLGALAGHVIKCPMDAIERVSQVMGLNGHTPCDALRLMAMTRKGAGAPERAVWAQIHREAAALVEYAAGEWNAATDAPEATHVSEGETRAQLTRCATDALPAVETRTGVGL